MFKHIKISNKQSPPHYDQQMDHLEQTPPVQRKQREIRLQNNENRNCSNFNLGGRSRPTHNDFCEFVCNEDYLTSKNSVDCEDYTKRSINIQPSCLSRSQDNFIKLTHSQQNILRKPVINDRVYGVGSNNISLTFGSMRQGILKNSLGANKQFLEEKKMKNEILDQIIRNASKHNLSSQDFIRRFNKMQAQQSCPNHDGKKGKYRIIGDIDDKTYYCSKCSIALLQQGYKVQEVGVPVRKNELMKRRKQFENLIGKVNIQQSKLKIHLDSMHEDESGYDFQGARAWLEETYEIIAFTMQQMKNKDIENLAVMQEEVNTHRKKQQTKLHDKLLRFQSIRDDLEHLVASDLTNITETQFSAILDSYSSSIMAVDTHNPDSICIKIETIDQKLNRLTVEVKQNFDNRSESRIQLKDQSSIISRLEEKLSDIAPCDGRNPFRNLFTEDEQSSNVHRHNPNIDKSIGTTRFSPKFRKLY